MAPANFLGNAIILSSSINSNSFSSNTASIAIQTSNPSFLTSSSGIAVNLTFLSTVSPATVLYWKTFRVVINGCEISKLSKPVISPSVYYITKDSLKIGFPNWIPNCQYMSYSVTLLGLNTGIIANKIAKISKSGSSADKYVISI